MQRPGLGIRRGRRRVRGRKRETASRTSQPVGREQHRGEEGANAGAVDRGRKAPGRKVSDQTDGKGLEMQGQGELGPEGWGEEAGKGQEQMRAAGALNTPLDTENWNGNGGVKE